MRLNRSDSSSSRSSGVALDLATYGFDGLPPLDPGALPGGTVEDRASAYVDALDLPRGVRRGLVLFRALCVLDDFERERDGRPSFEEEIVADDP